MIAFGVGLCCLELIVKVTEICATCFWWTGVAVFTQPSALVLPAVRDIATVNLIMKTGHSYSHWEYCRWCRRPPVTAGPVSPRRRWTGILACTERSCSLLLLWQLGVSIRRWLAAESNQFRSTCAHTRRTIYTEEYVFLVLQFSWHIYVVYFYVNI